MKPNIWHIYPVGDPQHETSGARCWCEPTEEAVERDDGKSGTVVLHRELH